MEPINKISKSSGYIKLFLHMNLSHYVIPLTTSKEIFSKEVPIWCHSKSTIV